MDASLDRRSRRRFFQLSLRTLLVCLATMPPLLAAGWAAGSALVEHYWPKEPDVWEEISGPGITRSFETNCTLDPESGGFRCEVNVYEIDITDGDATHAD